MARIAVLAEAARLEMGAPGLALGVIRDRMPAIARGFGVRRRDRPAAMTARTALQVEAAVRPLIAMALGRLVDLGRLSFDDRLVEVLPMFRIADPRGRDITLEHLMTQSSGLPPERPGVKGGDPNIALAFAPGRAFMPSKLGTSLLARVIEVVDGLPYEVAIGRHVLRRLGMRRSTLVEDAAATAPLPLYSDAEDMLRLLQVQLGESGPSQILSRSTALRLLRPAAFPIGAPGYPAGIRVTPAWFLLARGGHAFAVQGGGTSRSASLCLFSPEGRFGLFVAANAGQPPGGDSLRQFALAVIDEGLMSAPARVANAELGLPARSPLSRDSS